MRDDTTEALYFQKMFTVSTGHVTQRDGELLAAWVTAPDAPLWALDSSFGWIVWVDADNIPQVLSEGGSPALGQLIQFAKDNGCDWLRLDADVPVNKQFPRFLW